MGSRGMLCLSLCLVEERVLWSRKWASARTNVLDANPPRLSHSSPADALWDCQKIEVYLSSAESRLALWSSLFQALNWTCWRQKARTADNISMDWIVRSWTSKQIHNHCLKNHTKSWPWKFIHSMMGWWMSHIILPLAYMYVQERGKKSVNSTRWGYGMKPVDGRVKECLGVVKEWLVWAIFAG